MKTKFNLALLISLLLLLQTSFGQTDSSMPQEMPTTKLYLNGKPIEKGRCYSMKELEGTLTIPAAKSLVIANFYLVRGNAPVKAIKLEAAAAFKRFNLAQWAAGAAQSGDRVAVDLASEGQAISIMLCDM